MTVVYADSVFLLNALMDHLILTAAGRLAGVPLRRWSCIGGALLGGAYAAAVFLPGLEFLASPWVKAAVGVLMALAAFGGEPRLLRMVLLVLGVSCGMAGAVLVLGLAAGGIPMADGIFYTDVSPRVLLVAATAVYLVLTVVFRASAGLGVQGRLLPVKLCLGGRVCTLMALRDTGNGLRDPLTAQPVLVVASESLHTLFPPGLRLFLEPERLFHPAETMEQLRMAAPWLRPRLLPYQAVGTRQGLLLAVAVDWIEVDGVRVNGGLIALSPTELGQGYAALWGGEGKGEVYEEDSTVLVPDAAAAGAAACAGHSLYWRQ